MAKIKMNFKGVPEAEDFNVLPDGKYLATCEEIRETNKDGEPLQTKDGDPMWEAVLVTKGGDNAGRKIYDRWVFSERALKRIKLICSRFDLGLNLDGEVSVEPQMFVGRDIVITVETETYSGHDGKERKRNIVTYAGYERPGSEGAERAKVVAISEPKKKHAF